uniref:Arylesterase n=2 Tax=Caenorhabditis tropicalis TaxID=1561998 RepID=A0A1I7TK48_9PELO
MLLRITLFALLGILIQFVFKTLLIMDINKRVYNHRPGECRIIEGPEQGSEDFEVIEERQIAFISSGVVYLPHSPSDVTWKGEIYLYDLSKRTFQAESIPILNLEDVEGFYPHGLSHWILKDGTIRLFVVVHSKTFKHSVVILDYNEKRKEFNHVKTIYNEKFVRPNDIISTGENSFLVSNDGGAQTELGNIWEILSGFYRGGIVYFDGEGCHPVTKDAVAHLGNRSNPSLYAPSQVLRITFSNDFQSAEIVEILADDGRLVCASTIAFPFDEDKQILIGTVGRSPVHCDVQVPELFH